MRRVPLPFYLVCFLIMIIFVAGCAGSEGSPGPVGPAGAAGPVGPPGPAGEDATASQEYIGAEECGGCHEDIYATFALTGHANALTRIVDGQPPELPYTDRTGGLPDEPDDFTYADASYMIGGYGWKAIFVDQNGYLLTGEGEAATQYNFANEEVDAPAGWVSYHPGEQLTFECAVCHTTGYAPQGRQDNLEGISGTWAFEGVQCERCHGPGSRHADNPQGVRMVVNQSANECGDCHALDNPALIEADNGFEHHQLQFEDLYNSKHFALECVDCHDPHASGVFADEELNPNQGVRQVCESCHWSQAAVQNVRFHLGNECVDCHMPPMAFSAQGNLDLYTADVRSHQFSINTDPDAPQFTEDGEFVMPYLTLQYACGHCHNDEVAGIRDWNLMSERAKGYHTPPTPTPEPSPTPEIVETATPEP